MRPIWTIFANDMRKLWTNAAAAVIVLGLIALPSLYAWFNIEASWDPYGHTSGLKVAVVNEDEGTTVRGTSVRLGDEIVRALRANEAIGWAFMDERQAIDQVRHGDLYAAITIPSDFSARIATVLEGKPRKAELDYAVNEKINAIAPKITASGASGVVEEIRAKFVKTANNAIFGVLNEIGGELQANKPAIEQVRDIVFKLEAMMPDIRQAVGVAQADVAKAERIASAVRKDLPTVARLADQGAEAAARTSEFLDRSSAALDTAGPAIKTALLQLQATAGRAAAIGGAIRTAVQDDPEGAKTLLADAIPALNKAAAVSDGLVRFLNGLNRLGGGRTALAPALARAQAVGELFRGLSGDATALNEALTGGEQPAQEALQRLVDRSQRVSEGLSDLLGRYDTEIAPAVAQAVARAKKAAEQAQGVLNDASAALPDVTTIVNDASSGLARGAEALADIQRAMPGAESKIGALADRIRELEKEGNLDELIELLSRNAAEESDFFAEPVVLKETRLYPLPNYGSAMSPFFTTLSLWVGALLLVSLVAVEVHGTDADYESYQVYFGRFLTFLALAACQSLVVTIGDIYALGAFVADKVPFVLFGMLLSAVFMFIVYTLVSIFGNVGKAIAIVLLVLQLAGAGGTFPIEVQAPFFQAIHPFLPFTYGISLLREAVGGILWDIVARDLQALAIFAGIAFVLGVALKERINKLTAAMVRKAKESGLIH